MRWQDRRRSENVEDRRGIGPKGIAMGGGLGVVVLAILYFLLGGNPGEITQSLSPEGPGGGAAAVESLSAADKEMGNFAAVILADTEDVWNMLFREAGRTYREPKLVLFSDMTKSGCGFAQGATGPFYCPEDESVYIDLGFFREMQRQLGASGDFAMAYVIAHEVGHHVQNQLGIMNRMATERERLSETEFNRFMVQMELQADFLAGVWAHHGQRLSQFLEEGDIEEGVNAAAAVGDDRLQKRSQGYVVPDAFTHGTSEQRVRWFVKGFKTGDLAQGDTFQARDL
jgi:hypothetical protein